MALCAAVGLLLLVTGAWALPRPADLARGQEVRRASTPASRLPDAGAGSTPLANPSPTPSPTPSTTPSTTGPTTRTEATLVPDRGPGTYEEAGIRVGSTTGKGRLYRFDVRVEKGLDLDPDTVARALEKTLDVFLPNSSTNLCNKSFLY